MPNKIIKFCEITLIFTVLFAFAPLISYAQYSSVTNAATDITPSSATLNGTVSVVSGVYTSAWFEYDLNTNFGYATPRNSFGSGYFKYSYNISGLRPNTKYYFRTVTQNANGIRYGTVDSFITSFATTNNTISNPNSSSYISLSAITEPASSIASTSVQLNSSIYNENSNASNTWFEWGANLSLGNKTSPISTGGLPSVKHVNELTGLTPSTTYYFRAVVENATLRNNGSVLSFTTNSKKASANTTAATAAGANTSTGGDNAAINSSTSAISPSYALPTLGANVFGSNSGSFFPVNILGWLLLILLILTLVLIGKYFYESTLRKREMSGQPTYR